MSHYGRIREKRGEDQDKGVFRVTNNYQDETMMFKVAKEEPPKVDEVIWAVYQALKAKGYNPLNQIVGYLLSGDPAYITSHNNARNLIRKVERDEVMETLLKSYLEQIGPRE